MLAFRMVWLSLTLVNAGVAYVVVRRSRGQWFATAMAALLILYVPFLSPYVGYGADYLWHMLAALLAVRFLQSPPKHPATHALTGAVCALGVISNPTTITVVPFFVAALLLAHRGSDTRLRVVGWYVLGGLALGAAFVVTIWIRSGPGMLDALEQITSPDDHDFSLAGQVARLRQATALIVGPLVTGALLGATRLFVRSDRGNVVTLIAFVAGCLGAVAALLAGRVYLLIAPAGPRVHRQRHGVVDGRSCAS